MDLSVQSQSVRHICIVLTSTEETVAPFAESPKARRAFRATDSKVVARCIGVGKQIRKIVVEKMEWHDVVHSRRGAHVESQSATCSSFHWVCGMSSDVVWELRS